MIGSGVRRSAASARPTVYAIRTQIRVGLDDRRGSTPPCNAAQRAE